MNRSSKYYSELSPQEVMDFLFYFFFYISSPLHVFHYHIDLRENYAVDQVM